MKSIGTTLCICALIAAAAAGMVAFVARGPVERSPAAIGADLATKPKGSQPVDPAAEPLIGYAAGPKGAPTLAPPQSDLVQLQGQAAAPAAPSTPAAQSRKLLGNQRWMVLASRADVDEAIGIARYYKLDFPSVQVVKTNTDIYAVIAGPEHTTSLQTFRNKSLLPLPTDIFLSRGDGWGRVWPTRSPILAQIDYEGKKPVELHYGMISLFISREPDTAVDEGLKKAPLQPGVRDSPTRSLVPVLVARIGDKIVFTITGSVGEPPGEPPHARVFLIMLDRNSSVAQVVMTTFTGGAHCCTDTQIATSDSDGQWSVLEADTLDGDGYEFEDLGGDGVSELVSFDPSFLYAFDCHACSYPPLRIHKLEGTTLHDVRRDYPKRLQQDLYQTEYSAERNPELRHSNGFLAGWVRQRL